MKRSIVALSLILVTAALGFSLARARQVEKPASNEEPAIRAVADAFKVAFDKHDAKAISELFHPDAKVVTDDGEMVEGREAIAAMFAEQFTDSPDAKIEVYVESIKFVGGDLAFETGSTKTMNGPGESPELSRYTVVHIKRDGKWLMALARDTDIETPTGHEQLQALEWLVGDWIDESASAVVHTSCQWSADKNFLIQNIQATTGGKPTMTITQRIGWDAAQKCIRSWVFDSEGGHGEGTWARTDDGWLIKATGVRNDGAFTSATNTIVRTDKDSFTWTSNDRVAGGIVADPITVKIVRKPPTSQATKN